MKRVTTPCPKPRRAATALALVALATLAASGQEQDEYASSLYKFQDAFKAQDFQAAAQWCRRAADAKPEEYNSYYYLAEMQFQLRQFESTVASHTRAIEVYKAGKGVQMQGPPYLASVYAKRAVAYLHLGEIAKGRLDLEEALKVNPKDLVAYRVQGEYLTNAGELDKAIDSFDRAEKLSGEPSVYGKPKPELILWGRGQAKRQKGDLAGARADFQKIIELGGPTAPNGYVGLALLSALAEDPKTRDLKKARELLDTGASLKGVRFGLLEGEGIVRVLEGDAASALAYFAELGGLATATETIFHHGLAQLRAGSRDRAVELFTRAADMRPAARKRVETDPELAPVRAAVLAAVRELSGKKAEERVQVKKELDNSSIRLGYIAGLVRMFKYKAALQNLQAYAKQSRSETLRKTTDAWLGAIREYDALFAKVLDAVKKGTIKEVPLGTAPGAAVGKIVSADEETIELASSGGNVKGPWAIVPFDGFLAIAKTLPLGDADWFALGLLCLDNDRPAQAEDLFCQCLAKGKTYQARIDEVTAARRGVAVPPGGFVAHNGRLVSGDERENLKKGLVLFRGKWVSKEDKQHLEKNHEKIGGRWVPLTEEQLEKRGFVKYDGEWRTRDEVARLRGEWASAWELETEHYLLKTNKSEAFLKKLGVALEDGYQAYTKLFGRSPPAGQKMKAYAFAKFDDYKGYCDKLGHPEKYNATGFAPCEPGTLCGYDKFSEDRLFISTMVHEGCHLFHQLAFQAARPPSWVAEGMATYFEGFSFEEGGHLKWNHISQERLFAVKTAIRMQQLPPLRDFLAGDAGALIASDTSKALVFYAEAWAVYYFFNQTVDERYRVGFRNFMEAVNHGQPGDLRSALGPLWESFEADFVRFTQNL